MFDGLTERELLLYFALTWIVAVAVWILLDFLGNNWPKRRFRPRGFHIPFDLRRRGETVRSLRRFRDEQVRETLETATGRPTLSLSRKRRIRASSRRRPSWSEAPAAPPDQRSDRAEIEATANPPGPDGPHDGASGS